MPALIRPVVAFDPAMVEFSIVAPVVCRRLTPKLPPLPVTWTPFTVTLFAVISRAPLMLSPVMFAPAVVTSTDLLEASQDQPVPLVTFPGTACRVAEGWTPVVVASGNPHLDGAAEQLVCDAWAGGRRRKAAATTPAATMTATAAARRMRRRLSDRCVSAMPGFFPVLMATPGSVVRTSCHRQSVHISGGVARVLIPIFS